MFDFEVRIAASIQHSSDIRAPSLKQKRLIVMYSSQQATQTHTVKSHAHAKWQRTSCTKCYLTKTHTKTYTQTRRHDRLMQNHTHTHTLANLNRSMEIKNHQQAYVV